MYRAIYRGAKKLQKAFSLKVDSKAETGIGTLIIFIAMVLVAAVAATVLIHTAGTLQQRALSTGQSTTQQVSTGLVVQSIFGFDNSSTPETGAVQWLAIYVTPNAGSSAINLKNTTLELSYGGVTASLTYNGSLASELSGTQNIFSYAYFSTINGATNKNNSEVHFALVDLKDPSNSVQKSVPVLTTGGEVALLVNVSAVFGGNGVQQGQAVTGQVIPTVGSPGVIQFTSPLAYTQKVIELQ